MFSFVGETVFDPFMGSGTTALAARNLQRNSIGYEINPEYKKFYREKVTSSSLFGYAEFQYRNDESTFDINERMKTLPYLFQDPHKLENKIDIKKLQFGSRIDKNRKEREEYFSVKEIITPNMLKLNTGLTIKLIGVEVDDNLEKQAIAYIREKIKGHKVYMRFDETKYDNQNNLLCYLYLENKTFINAHLIKKRLVTVDSVANYKYKSKFISY